MRLSFLFLPLAAVTVGWTWAVANAAPHASNAQGIQTGEMDRKSDPCADFYQFANGAWRAKNRIPASMDRWSPRWQASEQIKDQLRAILEQAAALPQQPRGSVDQVIGDFYAACTNERAVNDAGVKPLRPLMAAIESVQDQPSLDAAIILLQANGVAVPFAFGSAQDAHDPQNVIADVGAAGLGLPDRDYYFKPDARFVQTRAEYLDHIQKMLQLDGDDESQAHAGAQSVMTLETALAKASLDPVTLRDPKATDHKMSFADLAALTPDFDWKSYYAAARIAPAPLNVDQPAFLRELARQFTATSLSAWRVYLRWHVLDTFAASLSQPFVDENFLFRNRQLGGVKELEPRPIRCAEQTDALFGDALGQEYVKAYFPPAAKQRAMTMTGNLLAAMHDTIEGADWMTAPTKQKALEKLSAITVKVGYPDRWRSYAGVDVQRRDYLYDVMGATRFAVDDERSLIGKPVDRSRWSMTAPTSNAYYDPQLNEIVFPAGILQPPAFGLNYVDAANYGAIGVVIGHEISHGFDDQGALFDAQGKLSDWWSAEDKQRFDAKTACVAQQFDGYAIGDGIHLNGRLVLGESIGDLGGVKIAYLAFQKAKASGDPEPTIDGYTPDQQFFIAWGQFRGDEIRPETEKLMVQDDPHPVAKFRVIGPLSDFPPFASAFHCPANAAMVRPESERCTVW